MKFTERTKLNLANVNKEVLEQWNAEDMFHKSIDEREGCPQFIFFAFATFHTFSRRFSAVSAYKPSLLMKCLLFASV